MQVTEQFRLINRPEEQWLVRLSDACHIFGKYIERKVLTSYQPSSARKESCNEFRGQSQKCKLTLDVLLGNKVEFFRSFNSYSRKNDKSYCIFLVDSGHSCHVIFFSTIFLFLLAGDSLIFLLHSASMSNGRLPEYVFVTASL
jgi:hypothetical protein